MTRCGRAPTSRDDTLAVIDQGIAQTWAAIQRGEPDRARYQAQLDDLLERRADVDTLVAFCDIVLCRCEAPARPAPATPRGEA